MKSGRIFFGLIFFLVVARPALAQEVGKIMSIVGTAEVLRQECWQSVSLHEALQAWGYSEDRARESAGSPACRWVAAQGQCQQPASTEAGSIAPTRRVAVRLI